MLRNVDWNQTQASFPFEKTLHELIEKQVKKSPNATACIFNENRLTYKELNQQANQLASFLKNKGVGKDSLVVISLERSLEMIIALLGVLKAGGAYVPADPSYPKERLRYILFDTKASLLITQNSFCEIFNFFQGEKLFLDQTASFLSKEDIENPSYACLPDSLAYVIYTSGSTGVPKGVCIQHRAIVNRIIWMQSKYGLVSTDKVLQKTPFSFDVSVWEFFWPLIVGAELHIIPPGLHQDPSQLIALIQHNHISVIHFVPSMLRIFLQTEGVENCESLKLFFSSGESLTVDLEKEFFLKMKGNLYNLYGPTEAAIDVTYWECLPDSLLSFVPIGKPISNIEIYILDSYLKPVPIGVSGELHIGGIGLAKGYLNQETLTKNKFIKHPFSICPKARLYKTGDIARYLPDGNIEYLGRSDQQVKIRGFRIELLEIEFALKKYKHVKEAIVIATQKQQLYAYIIPNDFTPDPIELKKHLEALLPYYMIPMAFLFLNNFPLTPNGKIDKKALLQQEITLIPAAYPNPATLPITEEETILAKIWTKLLNVEKIGIHDNFFHLGGDSIISIQVTSLAKQKGINFEIRQIFETPTIAGILNHAQKIKQPAQKCCLIPGKVELTPIQLWFFEQTLTCYNHFNQAMLLDVQESLDVYTLNHALQMLILRHEALQFKYTYISGQWQQEYPSSQNELLECCESVDLEQQISHAHKTIDIEKGRLFKAIYFPCSTGKPKLLLVIHHLIIDGISWRILLRDLEALYKGTFLPAKTASYQDFATALKSYGNHLQNEIPFWLKVIEKKKLDFPIDFDKGPNTNLVSGKVFISLSKTETSLLLRKIPSAYRTEINDILITALILAKIDWSGESSLYLSLEGHGRENIDDTLDISQTIGWFTSLYPVFLSLDYPWDIGLSLKSIKEQLRKIPKKGIGYGILKYLIKADYINECIEPQILFNYLGQWITQSNEDSLFQFAKESSGPFSAPENRRLHLIGINAEIKEEQLQVGFKFSTNHYKLDSISKLATYFQKRLQQIIQHCSNGKHFGYTPSDFPLVNINQEKLDQIFGNDPNIEEIYPLGPMQESLLFHALYKPNSDAYQIQTLLEIKENINIRCLQEAFQKVIENHSILRTAFIWKDLIHPIQVVYHSVPFHCSYQEMQNDQDLQKFLEKDVKECFEINQAPLFRIHLIRVNNRKTYLVWTRHHLILDGWSVPLILKEFLGIYHDQFPSKCRPYKDYINWLHKQDKAKSEQFWRAYLKSYKSERTLFNLDEKISTSYRTHHFCLSEIETNELIKATQKTSFTLNTVIQGAWSLILNRYLQIDDFIFGVTVSGRNIDLPGIEQMTGLFIHTLPLRVQILPNDTLLSLLERIQSQMLAIQEHISLPLSYIQSFVGSFKNPLFDHILIFENYPLVNDLPIQVHLNFHGHFDSNFINQLAMQLKAILTDIMSKQLSL